MSNMTELFGSMVFDEQDERTPPKRNFQTASAHNEIRQES